MRNAGIACIVAVIVVSAGCVSTPAEPKAIDVSYRGPARSLSADAPCIWIRDDRRRKAFYGVRVSSDEAMSWLEAGIQSQLGASTRVTESRLPEKGLLITLQKAYVNPIDTTLSGVVSIKTSWGERESVYRGQEVQTNWWGAEGEIGRTMSAALDIALQKINFPVGTSTCDTAHEGLMEAPEADFVVPEQEEPTVDVPG